MPNCQEQLLIELSALKQRIVEIEQKLRQQGKQAEVQGGSDALQLSAAGATGPFHVPLSYWRECSTTQHTGNTHVIAWRILWADATTSMHCNVWRGAVQAWIVCLLTQQFNYQHIQLAINSRQRLHSHKQTVLPWFLWMPLAL
jgi:hypothetical protein